MALCPTSPAPSEVDISSQSLTRISVTHSGKRQVRSSDSQRWSIRATYSSQSRSDFGPLLAFAVSQEGSYGSFTFRPTGFSSTSGDATSVATVDNAEGYSAGTSTVAADGLDAELKAGDFIKFANHDKVYLLTSDGTDSLSFTPDLVSSVVDGEQITHADVPFTVAFASDMLSFSSSKDGRALFSVDLVEVL